MSPTYVSKGWVANSEEMIRFILSRVLRVSRSIVFRNLSVVRLCTVPGVLASSRNMCLWPLWPWAMEHFVIRRPYCEFVLPNYIGFAGVDQPAATLKACTPELSTDSE